MSEFISVADLANLPARGRSETKVVRPFIGLALAEEVVSQVRLLCGSRVCAPLPDTEIFAVEALTADPLVFHFDMSIDDLRAVAESVDLPPDSLSLIVLARGRSLKITRVVYSMLLSEEALPERLEIDRMEYPLLFGDRGGLDLRVAIVLSTEQSAEILRPHLPGTWLARMDFRLNPEALLSSFSPKPLSAAIREMYSLPDGASSYVSVEMEDVLTADNLADCITQYVDEEILGMIEADMNDPWAIQLQSRFAIDLFTEVTEAIVRAFRNQSMENIDEATVRAYPAVWSFLRTLGQAIALSPEDLLNHASNDPARLRAHLESLVAMNEVTMKALREE